MERWYYFIRDEHRMILKKRTMCPPRPEDANPDYGDPLTPWYEVENHCDDHHVHVRAASESEATRLAHGLISSGAVDTSSRGDSAEVGP